jgi:hypothetical protein
MFKVAENAANPKDIPAIATTKAIIDKILIFLCFSI